MWLPDLWKIYAWLSNRALRRGEVDRAVEITARFARMRPKDPNAWILWSRMCTELVAAQEGFAAAFDEGRPWPPGSLDSVEEILDQGLVALPRNRELRIELAQVCLMRFYRERTNNKLEQAKGVLTELYLEGSPEPEVLMGLCDIAQLKQDWPEFDRLVDDVERSFSRTLVLEFLGALISTLCFSPNGHPRAEQMTRKIIELEPRHPAYHMTLGLLLEREDPEGAVREFALGRELMGEKKFEAGLREMREVFSRWGPEWIKSQEEPSEQ